LLFVNCPSRVDCFARTTNDKGQRTDHLGQNQCQPPPAPKQLLPAKYGDAARSPLKFEVKAGQKNHFDLQLAD